MTTEVGYSEHQSLFESLRSFLSACLGPQVKVHFWPNCLIRQTFFQTQVLRSCFWFSQRENQVLNFRLWNITQFNFLCFGFEFEAS